MIALLRQGKLCRDCSGGECQDKGTEAEPIVLECPTCLGHGCQSCDTSGEIRIEGCPNTLCRDLIPVVDMIDLFHKGLPPVAGGVLDQAAWFIAAANQLSVEEMKAKSE